MGESTNPRAKLRFDRRVRLEFHGATITSDAGLLACRELDDALGLTETTNECLQESRGGRNVQHRLVGLLRQSVYSLANLLSLVSRTEALAHADRRGSRTNQGPLSGGKRTPTQPDTSRNRPAGAPLRPPVIDGIEEHDPARRIEQLAQDSDLDRALRIEELDFLESSPHDH